MMKSTEDRPSNELAEPLDRPTARRIFAQGQVCSAFVVIAGVGRKNSAQMALAEDYGMIEALPADRADQSLRMPVRAINLLSPVHKELLPRYPVRTGEPIPSIRQFEKNADEILKAVRNGIASS